jgi:hypothetical protein
MLCYAIPQKRVLRVTVFPRSGIIVDKRGVLIKENFWKNKCKKVLKM